MRFLSILALLALTGCGLFRGVTPEDATANLNDVTYFTADVPPQDAYRAGLARERAAAMVDDAQAHASAVSAITSVAKVAGGGFPWIDVLTAASGLIGGGALWHSRKTRKDLNDPAAGKAR